METDREGNLWLRPVRTGISVRAGAFCNRNHVLFKKGRCERCGYAAIEGRYPPSVEYLEENYGILIDRDKYDVFYSGFASNFMPDITVNLHE